MLENLFFLSKKDFVCSFEMETKLKMPSGDLATFIKNVHTYRIK